VRLDQSGDSLSLQDLLKYPFGHLHPPFVGMVLECVCGLGEES